MRSKGGRVGEMGGREEGKRHVQHEWKRRVIWKWER